MHFDPQIDPQIALTVRVALLLISLGVLLHGIARFIEAARSLWEYIAAAITERRTRDSRVRKNF